MNSKVGLIGCGRWGSLLQEELESLDLEVFVYDPRVTLARVSAIEDLLEKVSTVFIASPSFQHSDQVFKALEAGCHVFCSKPLSFSWAVAKKLQDLAIQKKLVLDGGYVFRYADQVKEFIVDAKQCRPDYVSMFFENTRPPRTDSNIIFNAMIHCFDLAAQAFGHLEGYFYCRFNETEGHLQLRCGSFVLFSISVSCNNVSRRRFILSGKTEMKLYDLNWGESTIPKAIRAFLTRVDSRSYQPDNLLSIKYCETAVAAAQERELVEIKY